MVKIRLIVACFLAMSGVKSDLPVKCQKQKSDVGSTWTFHLNTDKQSLNIYNSTQVCGHNFPNYVQIIDENYKFGFESEDKVQIHIRTSSKVRAEYSNGNKVDGTWDVLYD